MFRQCLSVCQSVSLPVRLSVSVSAEASVSLSVCVSKRRWLNESRRHLSVGLYLSLSAFRTVCQSVGQSVCLSLSLSISNHRILIKFFGDIGSFRRRGNFISPSNRFREVGLSYSNYSTLRSRAPRAPDLRLNSRFDYCNAVLCGVAKYSIQRIRAQNCAIPLLGDQFIESCTGFRFIKEYNSRYVSSHRKFGSVKNPSTSLFSTLLTHLYAVFDR